MAKQPFSYLYLLILVMFTSASLTAQDASVLIKEIMKKQEVCWNKGDLECFMVGYWESDSLMFIGKDKVQYGYENTLMRYQTNYPNQEAMGQLAFDFINMRHLSEASFYVIGKYYLKRTIGDLEGHFTLLWKKIDGEWVIVADHSS